MLKSLAISGKSRPFPLIYNRYRSIIKDSQNQKACLQIWVERFSAEVRTPVILYVHIRSTITETDTITDSHWVLYQFYRYQCQSQSQCRALPTPDRATKHLTNKRHVCLHNYAIQYNLYVTPLNYNIRVTYIGILMFSNSVAVKGFLIDK